ncbi:MAG: DUF5683 domain-containing protein [Algoriphagus aquaeductus]|uniref:DUF5683 domain-containing protein n=1 Tax=Algoriphagus aquaeductus TaxID=475299 RepID=UPI003879AF54
MFFLLDQKTKKTPWIILGLLLFVFSGTITTTAQTTRITEEVEAKPKTANLSTPKNPRKAVILSAILPGAGQVYNEKSWKVPILYAGFMADIYFIGYNNKRYVTFRDALFAFDDGEANQFPTLNRNALVRNIEYWRQNRDMTILLLLGIYALNLVDATVDAHLSGFDISDEPRP